MKALRRSQTSSSSNSPSPSSSSPSSSAVTSSSSWIHLRSVLFVVASSSPAYCSSSDRCMNRRTSTYCKPHQSKIILMQKPIERGHLKSPWSRRKRKHVLAPLRWRSFFTPDGKLRNGGVKFLKKVRSGGVDPSIRAEVWPFLLGVYELESSKKERDAIRKRNRKEYERLRRKCCQLLRCSETFKMRVTGGIGSNGDSGNLMEGMDFPDYEDVVSALESLSSGERSPFVEDSENQAGVMLDEFSSSKRAMEPHDVSDSESSDSDSSADHDASNTFLSIRSMYENTTEVHSKEDSSPSKTVQPEPCNAEDFATWQRIIRVDAVRANEEWIAYSTPQAGVVSDGQARCSAQAVGLKDYDHLEPSRIFHAARLVAILEAYALYDPEIGYCQGMSDLLSPIITVMTEDHEAFWCFVGFMRKARHNFRLDEVGIRRQLKIISKIIKHKDSHLYRHLEKLQAEDCFFVYRMVVVLFRRELTFEQTLCLWEVMWADQAAIRAGIGKSAWSRIRQRAPPTDDLLLYAIAASVLQRRKQITEKYSSMDEILKECNNMAGHLDVWKLLDDAHDLVVTLHDKI
ncbi:rab GTPase-activating protein 22-like isoform X2 [Lycium barbarum]|uniref:rab GTPase-activating protein 22-like isoform X2 n=1 Tax=Lycium barbarum TaxID=112863 RepID=UPI00293F289E|nr:rab GTPase-activating protein 22-like isoform X2 [Lycium barbarum]